ncbi:hypothetical protein [Pedobacter sp. N23S346]|uniref:hypothetical protein n=1 Tax=Pedobacter sp. N23S346 TaxID=3402750 RepID=UPI003AC4A864
MRNDNGKNLNTQLPDQVVAVKEFQKLIADYFQVNSLAEINRILIELISAAIGPDPSTGKHAPIDISNTLYHVRNTINLIAKTKDLTNEASLQRYTEKLIYQISSVNSFDIDHLNDLLFFGLDAYIYQDEGFEGATLNFSNEITYAYKMIYDWLADCDEWYKSLNAEE